VTVQDELFVEERVDGVGDWTRDVALRRFFDAEQAVRLTSAAFTHTPHYISVSQLDTTHVAVIRLIR